ncbi:MAG: FAD synthetase [Clostridium cadaveris]|uniref:FAD synthetase n=1 Tax=Clostridium cadaveris TaxID=1529 RepID=A0A316M122_9CLOT|nr:MAG: FAD synthetase [Clostridium cadaveris]
MRELLIEKTLLGEINKVELAIERAKAFEPNDRPYLLAFSGGKDSVAAYYILKMAEVNFKAKYSPTSVDPPEVVRFIRKYFPDVEFEKYTETMWELIPRKLFPPNRRGRYCCDVLKERTGELGDTVVTGVRWEESNNRKKQGMVGFWKGKTIVRPIIDWTSEDVWEFIRNNNIPYCELYDKGWERVGCIGCPLNSKNQAKELEAYPSYKKLYIRAFDRMILERIKKGKVTTWKNGEEVMEWWINQTSKEKIEEGQCSFFGD